MIKIRSKTLVLVVAVLFSTSSNPVGAAETETPQALQLAMDEVQTSPENADAHFKLGNEYSRQGRDAEAVEAYQKAIALNANHVDARFQLGMTYMEKCQYELSIEQMQAVLRIRPDYDRALTMIDQMEALPGDTMRKKEKLCRVLQILEIIKPLQGIQGLEKVQKIHKLPTIPADIPKPYNDVVKSTRSSKVVSVPKKLPKV